MLNGLNHITLATCDLKSSFGFYVDLLGFKPHAKWMHGAYLSLGDLWLCLSVDDNTSPVSNYTHLAFSVEQEGFSRFVEQLIAAGAKQWKENKSEGDSFYFLDPDGHKLEIHVGGLQSRLESLRFKPYEGLEIF